MASIDQILKQNFGLTGKAESFNARRKPVKRYNAERYLAAYTALKADEQKQIAEAAMLRVEVMTMKARGEADETIVTKVKNAGKNLWRGIKNLIGKLVILITELFAKMMSKVGKAKKLADKLKSLMNDINSNRDKLGEVKAKLPLGGTVADFSSAASLDDAAVKEYTTNTPKGIMARLKDSGEKFKMFCKAFNTKGDYNNTVQALAKEYTRATGLGFYADKSFNDDKADNTIDVQSFAASNMPEMSGLIGGAILLKSMQSNLEKSKTAYADRKDAAKNEWKETEVSGAEAMLKILKASADLLISSAKNVEDTNKNSAMVRNHLNKVKNAPTSVTNGLEPEVIQFIRKFCSRATTFLNTQRKYLEIDLALLIYNISNIHTGISSAVKEAKKGK